MNTAEPKLKWKPYRPSQATPVAPEVAEHPADAKPLKPTPETEKAEAVQKAGYADRAQRRNEILPVAAQEQDPFRDPFNDTPLPSRTQSPALAPPTGDLPAIQAESQPSPSGRPAEPMVQPEVLDFRPESSPTAMAAGPDACLNDKKDCVKDFQRLKANTINNIDLDISVTGAEGTDFPCECTLGDEQFQPRAWQCITYNWKASGLCHKPLYFEDVQLERYGHSHKPLTQMVLSGAHFFATLPVLPYKMGLEPPCECIYSLGYYRPGSCAPYLVEPIPFSLRAALFEAGAVAGGILLIP